MARLNRAVRILRRNSDLVEEVIVNPKGLREARLKHEFAHLYPPLTPGQWEIAGLMADQMVAWLLRAGRGYQGPARALRSEHFDFRGGDSGARAGAHSRREDAGSPESSIRSPRTSNDDM
jgi:hypothetical protein